MSMRMSEFDGFLTAAMSEDIGGGDVTTRCCVPENAVSNAVLLFKEGGVLCGMDIFHRVMELCDPRISIEALSRDGADINKGSVVARINGPSRGILTAERTALNLLQRMSGIATASRAAASAVLGFKARVTDTRKTTPGMRTLEKYAVRTGGAVNHRFGLYDGILIKDNHIAAAGGIQNAVKAVRLNAPHTLKIEVEVTNFAQIDEALNAKADIIMLDNMSIDEMRRAVMMIAGRALVEASGNMGKLDLREVAATGVDLISVGALTHSARSLDISLLFLDADSAEV